MPLPQIPLEGGDWQRTEHFSYAATAPKATWHAYIAGPTLWFMCHQPKKTKPCIAILTNRAVDCPWCGTDKPVVPRGYVPLYRASDWAPRCVIVNDLYKAVIDKLKLHDRVTLGKDNEPADPVWISRALIHTPTFNTTMKHRVVPADLTESLLKIWGSSDLVSWWKTVGKHTSDTAVSLPKGTAVDDRGAPVSPMMQAAAKRNGFDVVSDDPLDIEEDAAREHLRALQEGLKPAINSNGKHKPKKG